MKLEGDRLEREHRLANPPSFSISDRTKETLSGATAAFVGGCVTGAAYGASTAAGTPAMPLAAATGCLGAGAATGMGYCATKLAEDAFSKATSKK